MTYAEVNQVLLNEAECVSRAHRNVCNRDCGNCDLVMPSKDIIRAYITAISAIAACLQMMGESDANKVLIPNKITDKAVESILKEGVYEN